MYVFLPKGMAGRYKYSLVNNGWESNTLEARSNYLQMDVFKKSSSSETLPTVQNRNYGIVFGFVPYPASGKIL